MNNYDECNQKMSFISLWQIIQKLSGSIRGYKNLVDKGIDDLPIAAAADSLINQRYCEAAAAYFGANQLFNYLIKLPSTKFEDKVVRENETCVAWVDLCSLSEKGEDVSLYKEVLHLLGLIALWPRRVIYAWSRSQNVESIQIFSRTKDQQRVHQIGLEPSDALGLLHSINDYILTTLAEQQEWLAQCSADRKSMSEETEAGVPIRMAEHDFSLARLTPNRVQENPYSAEPEEPKSKQIHISTTYLYALALKFMIEDPHSERQMIMNKVIAHLDQQTITEAYEKPFAGKDVEGRYIFNGCGLAHPDKNGVKDRLRKRWKDLEKDRDNRLGRNSKFRAMS